MFRNYGSLFQCYALQQVLKNAGHTPFLIRRRVNSYEWTLSRFFKRLIWVLLHPLAYLNGKIWSKHQTAYVDITAEGFRSFFHAAIVSTPQQYGERELMTSPPEADCYICGSDQVWTGAIPSAFLLFAEGHKRIAYAASCKWLHVDKEWRDLARQSLPQFHAISVREKVGCEICNSLLSNSSHSVSLAVDPVLLLTPEAWNQLARGGGGYPAESTYCCRRWGLIPLRTSVGMLFCNTPIIINWK